MQVIPVMATFAQIVDEIEISYMVERGVTHRQIAIHFQNIYPNVRVSVKEVCKDTVNYLASDVSPKKL